MIKIEDLCKSYKDTAPLKNVNAVINDGDVVSIIGPSGTGKSTLLRCINLLEKPTSGRIFIDGTEVTSPDCNIESIRGRVGMVFQSFNLFPHLTAIENIMLAPVDLLKKDRQEAYVRGMELLHTVGLPDKALSYPDELSGGQKQRIAIARTLAMEPEVILLDEPTSALDPTMVGEVQSVIRELTKLNKTMLIVTHEMNFARAISNRVFYMDEGSIYEEGTPDQIFDHPKKEKTRRFIHRLMTLTLDADSDSFDFPGTRGKIESYCIKNQVPYRMTLNTILAFEELIQLNLIKSPEKREISISFEFSADENEMVFTIDYSGNEYNAFELSDPVSLGVLNTAVTRKTYSFDDKNKLGNRLVLLINQG